MPDNNPASGARDDAQRQLRKAKRKCASLEARIDELEQALAEYQLSNEDTSSNLSWSDTEPVWDASDQVYRCTACCWEVIDGMCHNCGEGFVLMKQSLEDSISTSNEALNPDRTSHKREDTPLRELEASMVPKSYQGREEEYKALLGRGATRLMCETFDLEYLPDTGIIAWADQALFDEFTGDGMKRGDRWKIRLGRRIQLDEEDLDGSLFIEELLEDAILYPLRPSYIKSSAFRWETVKSEPGVWETKSIIDIKDQIDREVAQDEACGEGASDTDPEDADAEDVHLRMDKALENPSAFSENIVIDPGYESAESEAGEQPETPVNDMVTEQDEDPGWSFSPRSPDAIWSANDDDEDNDDDDDGDDNGGSDANDAAENAAESEPKVPSAAGEVEDVEMADDSADSDFDADEVLSGDEDVVSGRCGLPPTWDLQTQSMNLYTYTR